MAIQIPSIQGTPISSNVRRADIGVTVPSQQKEAWAHLGDVVANIANKTAAMRTQDARVKARQEAKFAWSETDVKTMDALDKLDGDGQIEVDGQKTDALQHVQEVNDKRIDDLSKKFEDDPEVVEDYKLAALEQQAKVSSLVNRAKAEDTKNKIAKTIDQLSIKMQSNPRLVNLDEEISSQERDLDGSLGVLKASEVDSIKTESKSILTKSYMRGIEDREGASVALKMYSTEGIKSKIDANDYANETSRLKGAVRTQQKERENSNRDVVSNVAEASERGFVIDDKMKGLYERAKNELLQTGDYKNQFQVKFAEEKMRTAGLKRAVYQGSDTDAVLAATPESERQNAEVALNNIKSEHKMKLVKEGASYLASVDPSANKIAAAMIASPEEFDRGIKYFQARFDNEGIPASFQNVVPQEIFKPKKDILTKAIAEGNGAVVVAELQDLRELTGNRYNEAVGSLLGGKGFSPELKTLARIKDEAVLGEQANILLNPKVKAEFRTAHSLDDKSLRNETKSIRDTLKERDELAFIGAVGNSSDESKEELEDTVAGLSKLVMHYRTIGYDEDEAVNASLRGFNSTYNFVNDKKIVAAIPKYVDSEKVRKVAELGLSDYQGNQTFERLFAMRGMEKSDDKDREMLEKTGKWQPNKNNTGLELWGLNVFSGQMEHLTDPKDNPVTFSYEELEQVYSTDTAEVPEYIKWLHFAKLATNRGFTAEDFKRYGIKPNKDFKGVGVNR